MKRLVFALAAVLLSTAALADDAGALYAKRCAACHGKDGKGTSVGQKMGAKDLAEAQKHSEEELATIISEGKGKMTPFKGKLTDEEIKSLAKYVKSGVK